MKLIIGKYEVLIDDEDYENISKYKWYVLYNGFNLYVATKLKDKSHIYMHRLIMKINGGDRTIQVDHINRDSLDNRKCNLRLATNGQNNVNKPISSRKKSVKFKGVSYYPNERREKKYLARICVNLKQMNLGWYICAEEAALAYNNAASKYFGEFAYLNVV
jgi:hypothetical protein